MMEENVVTPAGADFRLQKEEIEALITESGYEPHRRDNWYRLLDWEPPAGRQSRNSRIELRSGSSRASSRKPLLILK